MCGCGVCVCVCVCVCVGREGWLVWYELWTIFWKWMIYISLTICMWISHSKSLVRTCMHYIRDVMNMIGAVVNCMCSCSLPTYYSTAGSTWVWEGAGVSGWYVDLYSLLIVISPRIRGPVICERMVEWWEGFSSVFTWDVLGEIFVVDRLVMLVV